MHAWGGGGDEEMFIYTIQLLISIIWTFLEILEKGSGDVVSAVCVQSDR